ncbi:MAG: hypothetical protein HY606_06720, partial [Planctomycetes bacterium]|nr:hypothetical protein [Planctomycetota bacterium]
LNKSFNETIVTDIHNNIKKQILETPVPSPNGPIWSIPSLLFTWIISKKLLVLASVLLIIQAVIVVQSFTHSGTAVYDTSNVNKGSGSSGSEANNLSNSAIASSSNEHLNLPAKNPASKVTGVLKVNCKAVDFDNMPAPDVPVTIQIGKLTQNAATNRTGVASFKIDTEQAGDISALRILPASSNGQINSMEAFLSEVIATTELHPTTADTLYNKISEIVGFPVDRNYLDNLKNPKEILDAISNNENIDPNLRKAINNLISDTDDVPYQTVVTHSQSPVSYYPYKEISVNNTDCELNITLEPLKMIPVEFEIASSDGKYIDNDLIAEILLPAYTARLDYTAPQYSGMLKGDEKRFLEFSAPISTRIDISISIAGFQTYKSRLELLTTDEKKIVSIILQKHPHSLNGRVIDNNGNPLAGAVVSINHKESDTSETSTTGLSYAFDNNDDNYTLWSTTDPNGEFTISGIKNTPLGSIIISHPDCDDIVLDNLDLSYRVYTLKKITKGTIEFKGKVINKNGDPLPWVTIKGEQLSTPDSGIKGAQFEATTDKDGYFILNTLLNTQIKSVSILHKGSKPITIESPSLDQLKEIIITKFEEEDFPFIIEEKH